MHIRTATAADQSQVLALVATLSQAHALPVDDLDPEPFTALFQRALSNGLAIVVEHPSEAGTLIGVILAHRAGTSSRKHVFTGVTLAVHPHHQQKKIGRTLLTIFLEEVGHFHHNVGRVEVVIPEAHTHAIQLFQSMGFLIEGRWEMRLRNADGSYQAEIPMGWHNPNFEFEQP